MQHLGRVLLESHIAIFLYASFFLVENQQNGLKM